MKKHTSTYALLGFLLLVIVVIGGLLWVNYKFFSNEIVGTDFYTYWFGTRALLVDGLSPYSEVVIKGIETSLPNSKLAFYVESSLISMPLYAIIITLPFAVIENFKIAGAFWMTAQEIGWVVVILMVLKITNWRPRLIVFAFIIVASLLSIFPVVILISGNMIIWTSLFFILALGALQGERDELAGGLLTLTTIQPHIFILSNVFILVWAVLKKRQLFIAWFFGLLIIMTIIGIFLIADWPVQYLRILLDAFDNSIFTSPREIFVRRWPGIGIQLSWMLTIFTATLLIVEWWSARYSRYRWFFWTVCLTLVLYWFIGGPIHLNHNLIFFIPILLVMSIFKERWQTAGSWINVTILICILIVGWFFYLRNVPILEELSGDILYFALPTLILIALYWVRWWTIRDQRLYVPDMLARE